MNLWPLAVAFVLIASAELGDKTQLLTLSLAARYPFWEVILAISAATSVLMALAVVFGEAVYFYIPSFYIQALAAAVFIFFGFWTLFHKEKEEELKAENAKGPFAIVFSSFFIAELGDKTQIAALTLSAQYGSPFLVWAGATLGMIFINVVAAIMSSFLKKFVSERRIKWFGGIIFLVFGAAAIIDLLSNK